MVKKSIYRVSFEIPAVDEYGVSYPVKFVKEDVLAAFQNPKKIKVEKGG